METRNATATDPKAESTTAPAEQQEREGQQNSSVMSDEELDNVAGGWTPTGQKNHGDAWKTNIGVPSNLSQNK